MLVLSRLSRLMGKARRVWRTKGTRDQVISAASGHLSGISKQLLAVSSRCQCSRGPSYSGFIALFSGVVIAQTPLEQPFRRKQPTGLSARNACQLHQPRQQGRAVSRSEISVGDVPENACGAPCLLHLTQNPVIPLSVARRSEPLSLNPSTSTKGQGTAHRSAPWR